MPWTFKHASTDQSFEAWGFTSCSLIRRHAVQGEFTAEILGDARASLPFAVDDAVELRLDGVVKWRGVYTGPARSEQGNAETIKLVFADLWYWLDQAPFANFSTGETVLFAAVDFEGNTLAPISLSDQLQAIVEACDWYFGGSKMQFGSVSSGGGITPPPQSVALTTCGDAIRAALRWAPDAIAAWDDSTTPPTLNFVRRADAAAITLAASGLDSHQAQPRYDLQSRGAVLNWYSQLQGQAPVVFSDTAGTTTGTRVIRAAFKLKPETIVPGVTQSCRITSAAELDESSASFWASLGGVKAETADIVVGTSGRSGSSLTRRVVSGMVPSWMNAEAHLGEVLLYAYLTIRVWLDPADHSKGYTLQKGRYTISFAVTDLDGLYTNVVQQGYTIPGDAVPVGLAASLYAATSALQWQGEAALTADEIAAVADLGDLLNVSGSLSDYASMAAQINEVEQDFTTASTTLRFGPSGYLSPADWAAWAANLQPKRADDTAGLAARASVAGPATTDDATVAESTPVAASVSPAGGTVALEELVVKKGDYTFTLKVEDGVMKLEHASDINKSFIFDLENDTEPLKLSMADDEGGQLILKPRPMKMCVIEDDEVVEKKVMVLMSDHSDNITVS